MITPKNQNNKAFIALFSVIIISAILVLTAVTLSFSGFYARFNILDTESKERSNALADSCIDSARLAIAEGSYTTGVSINTPVDTKNCTYTINAGGKVVATGTFENTYTYYYAEIDTADDTLPFIDFKECASLSPCP